jgi:response regulator RpfG family c-di-GMP phosphodiesterase
MIARHAALACLLAEELGLPPAVREAVASSSERWDGRGWPGALKTEQVSASA